MKNVYLTLIAIAFAINISYAQWSTSGSNIYYNSGNVGIGTTSPFSPLHVIGREVIGAQGETPSGFFLIPSIGDNQLYLSSSTAPSINVGTSFSLGGRYNSSNQYQIAYGSLVGAKENTIDADVAGYLAFYTANFAANADVEQMRINSLGNVGIGTTTPDAKLAVNGTVHSKEVLVNLTGFSDYVFKPTYHLPTLTEVKTYIDQNHHLPDMPTEAEVVKNGLKVGETEALLTKKVEELTLYLIDLKKENEALKQNQQAITKKLKQYHIN